ncbi:MAG TPA: tetratricopeptide repeat protein [Phycisphaerae bacterium]|nr:tetratricopeptide repeat protein [Phycisphaerae bacterium]
MRKLILAVMPVLVLSANPARGVDGVQAATAEPAATRPAGGPAQTRPADTTRPAEPDKPASLTSARRRYTSGDYAGAIGEYRTLAESAARRLEAHLGLADCYAMTGKYDDAKAALRAVAALGERDAPWHVLMSQLHARVGEYAPALDQARQAVACREDWAPAIYQLGRSLEIVGSKAEAVQVYKTIEKSVQRSGFTQDAPSLVAAGQTLNRIAILTGQKASEQAQNILHNYLQEAYQRADKTYWPAHIAAAELLLEKHKGGPAGEELKLAAKINKNLPDVHVGNGVLLLATFEFEKAVAEAKEALKINSNCTDAMLLEAATLMRWQKLSQAQEVLEKLLKVNPNDIQALSMMAAVHMLRYAPAGAEPYIKRGAAINPDSAEMHETIGDWLSSARQFDEAEAHFRKAMEMAPELAGPVTGLGRLYMQTGWEELAHETLDKAFQIDDFRADVKNYLDLLDAMKSFSVRETPHFIIKVDGKHDEVLLEWIAEVAEEIHEEVSRDFAHTPEQKTLVEMFPDQAKFSMRISGRGWLPTVGACTGRVIAMPAPDPLRGGFGQFNWYAVLRHEYTHAVTLTATRNRIPHWFTEACAVWEQPDRRNFQAVGLLVEAVRSGKLYPVEELSWGFIRPQRDRGAGARSLAYAQSEWVFEYIDERKGRQTILEMLKAFGDGRTQADVFQNVVGIPEKQFDKDFGEWAVRQITSWGFDADPTPNLKKAQQAVKDKPDSADAQADLALAYYRAHAYPSAEAAARKAVELKPAHTKALGILGAAQASRKKYKEAIETARKLEAIDPQSANAAQILAKVAVLERDWPTAIPALERYKQILPWDDYGYVELAKIYDQLGQMRLLLPNLVEMHRRTMKDPKYARRAADIYRASDAPAEAIEFYEQVIQINPYDAGAYQAMAALALRLKQYDRALAAMRSKSLLEPDNARTWAELAMVYYRVACQKKSAPLLIQARQAAGKAIEIDPESYGKDVLELIEQTKF